MMEINKTIELFRSMLNFLSESSDDYFFLWDIPTGQLHLSEKIAEKYDLMQMGEKSCTLADWKRIVYPPDLPALSAQLEQIQRGETLLHDMEYRLINRNGEIVWISCRGKSNLSPEGVPKWMIGRISDSVFKGKLDQLTGAFLMDTLHADIGEMLRTNADGYLLMVELDNLKSINFHSGRQAGDQLLKKVCHAMEDLTNGIRVYRVNGDCFCVCLPENTPQEVEKVFCRLQERLKGQCTLTGGCVPFRQYIIPDAETLYQYAENSLDNAKARGRNTLWFFSAEDYEKDLAALELREDLKKSVHDGFTGFSMVYQPQVGCGQYQLYGCEALLRYHSPNRGDVSPGDFIPVLEQTGLIREVGIWVLREALRQCGIWRQYQPQLHMSVNMSYSQLCEEDITGKVLHTLRQSGLPGSALTIEVTESMQLHDYPYLNDIFRQWKRLGISISVDDFGTGYSSLGRLKEMEIDEIKIDRSFVSNIHNSAYNYRLLSNMLELARVSHIRVCCEGVEQREELEALEKLHPDLIQGFLFGKPSPAEEFTRIWFDSDSDEYRLRTAKNTELSSIHRPVSLSPANYWREDQIVHAIIEASDDIVYVSDLYNYELYYLNPAGQKLMGCSDFKGKKCYQVLQGRSEPCSFCNNQILTADRFYIWERENEYCKRHFLLKDKLIHFQGRQARMEIALDITRNEIVSREVKERLTFARKIVDYTQTISGDEDYDTTIRRILEAVGDFYQADRSYIFQPDPADPTIWNNTFEWCRSSDVIPQQQNLMGVSEKVLHRWLELFRQKESVIIFNPELIRKVSPQEYEMLHAQDISRLIASPLYLGEQLFGFIGVDNPRYFIHDDSHIRVLSSFLLGAVRKKRNDERVSALLHYEYGDILREMGIGLWVIRKNDRGIDEMLADNTMLHVMGVEHDIPSPEECYQFWYSRVNDGYYHYVNQAVEAMYRTGEIVQLEYTWKHPTAGEVVVRCTGKRFTEPDGRISIRGYHRIISNIQRPQFLPDIHQRDVFEFNELSHSIFFHTARTLISGQKQHESDFPESWLREEIVHPHFQKRFSETFSRVRVKSEVSLPEILLKSRKGTYEWFRMLLRHPGTAQQDLDTVVVTIEPVGRERTLELENMRLSQFYQAMLSESIGYAEVDLESGQLKSAGGLWMSYRENYLQTNRHFIEVLSEKLQSLISPEELKLFRSCQTPEGWQQVIRSGKPIRLCYRRPIRNKLSWVELVMHIFQEEITQNVYGLLCLRDINAQKQREDEQLRAASRDPLTGIFNRTAFEQAVTNFVRSSVETPCGVLILMDIDNFKKINDQMGHLKGDEALRIVSHILLMVFGKESIIGRLGGDEFLVFVYNCDYNGLVEKFNLLLEQLQTSQTPPLSSSIGATFVSPENFSYIQSLREADTALYHSKQNGKNQFRFYRSFPSHGER